jgi:hypothetical protein
MVAAASQQWILHDHEVDDGETWEAWTLKEAARLGDGGWRLKERKKRFLPWNTLVVEHNANLLIDGVRTGGASNLPLAFGSHAVLPHRQLTISTSRVGCRKSETLFHYFIASRCNSIRTFTHGSGTHIPVAQTSCLGAHRIGKPMLAQNSYILRYTCESNAKEWLMTWGSKLRVAPPIEKRRAPRETSSAFQPVVPSCPPWMIDKTAERRGQAAARRIVISGTSLLTKARLSSPPS